IASSGFDSVLYSGVFKIIAFIFLAPAIGGFIAIVSSAVLMHAVKNKSYAPANKAFRRLQLISAAADSLGHGSNDAQKIMGIIFVALIASDILTPNDVIPFWVVITSHTAMAIGTLLGGWRIVKTMGSKLTHLGSFQGFCAETGGAITLFTTSMLGIPVSTTHTITGAIVGTGSIKRLSAVRWGLTRNLIIAWIITIPVTALLSVTIFYLTAFLF